MIGDYAEEGDLRGRDDRLGATEDLIYGNAGDKQISLDAKATRRKSLKDLAEALLPIYERSHGMRCSDLNQDGSSAHDPRYGMRDFFPAKKTEQGWDLDLDLIEEADREQTLQYYERCGAMSNTAWKRPALTVSPDKHFTPLNSVPETIPEASDGQGDAMIWVNLDRQEFIDPAAFDETPDLAGIMIGESARSVLAMLVHHERRGGGDLGDLGPIQIAGRWRGDRIVLLGSGNFRAPKSKAISQDTVRKTYVDVTDNALAFIRCVDYFGTESFDVEGDPRSDLSNTEKSLVAIAMKTPGLRNDIEKLSLEITPPTVIKKSVGGETPLPRTLNLAGTFDVYVDGGKVFIPASVREEMSKIMTALPPQTLDIKLIKNGRHHMAQIGADTKAVKNITSNHEVIAACSLAA
jgi:hypothetical protein